MRRISMLVFGVFCVLSSAQRIHCEIENPDPTVGGAIEVEIQYPKKGETLYKIELTESPYTYVPRPHVPLTPKVLATYEGTGRIDRRFLDGKLTLLTPGTTDVAGELEFVMPEVDPDDITDGVIPGAVQRLTLGTNVHELSYCYQETAGGSRGGRYFPVY